MTGWKILLCALAFCMIFECLTPLVSPAHWKKMLRMLLSVPDGVIQKLSAAGVIFGLAVIWMIRSDF